MSEASFTSRRRRETRAHYDRYPYGFDQDAIVQDKLETRVMGEAIREVVGPDSTVIDIGCGACRVAQMVKQTSGALTVGVDLSLVSLRAARKSAPWSLANGDNLQLPLRDGAADLVISNGVIHHTPNAKQSFMELARITKPGGTLVVSVYRKGWYYYLFRYAGGPIRWMRKRIGDRGLKLKVLPFEEAKALPFVPDATFIGRIGRTCKPPLIDAATMGAIRIVMFRVQFDPLARV